MNDRTAKRLLETEDGCTLHIEYACPCGKGKVIDERVRGFGDYCAWIECKNCEKKYEIVTGCGYIWELRKK